MALWIHAAFIKNSNPNPFKRRPIVQDKDNQRIEHLKKDLSLNKKIDVIRAALSLLEKEAERVKRIARWKRAAKLVAKSSGEVNKAFSIAFADKIRVILPRRWYIYTVDLEPRVGTKPGKQRPCLAIQPTEFAEGGLKSTVVLPLTSKLVIHSIISADVILLK